MKMRRLARTSFTYPLFVKLSLTCAIAVFALGSSFIGISLVRLGMAMGQTRSELLEARKRRIKEEVDDALRYLEDARNRTEAILRAQVRERTLEGWNIAASTIERTLRISGEARAQEAVRETLRPIRFNQGRGYYFIGDLDGREILFPTAPQLEGSIILGFKDDAGSPSATKEVELVRREGEGFVEGHWIDPASPGLGPVPKLSYVKLLPAFGWYIGSGEYLSAIEKKVKEDAIAFLAGKRFESGGSLFAATYEGSPLFASGMAIAGELSLHVMEEARRYGIYRGSAGAVGEGGGFVEYEWPRIEGGPPFGKIAYVQGYAPWRWTIGAGVFTDDIEAAIRGKSEAMIGNAAIDMGLATFVTACALAACYAIAAGTAAVNAAAFDSFVASYEKAAAAVEPMDLGPFRSDELLRLGEAANRATFARRAIDASLRETIGAKEELLREVHHRVKNNLQSVLSIISIQMAEETDGAARAALERNGERIRAIAMAQEQVYALDDLKAVPIALIAEGSARAFNEMARNGGVDFMAECVCDGSVIQSDSAIALGIVLEEMLSRFYRSERGPMTVSIRGEREGEDIVFRLSRRLEVAPYEPPSLAGLDFLRDLLSIMGGILSEARDEEGSSVAEIRLPAPERGGSATGGG